MGGVCPREDCTHAWHTPRAVVAERRHSSGSQPRHAAPIRRSVSGMSSHSTPRDHPALSSHGTNSRHSGGSVHSGSSRGSSRARTTQYRDCDECDGKGRVKGMLWGTNPCKECKGKGKFIIPTEWTRRRMAERLLRAEASMSK